MNHITHIVVEDTTFPGAQVFKKNKPSIPCSSCVFLVGDQGVGKSTLLKMLKQSQGLKIDTHKDISPSTQLYYFDTEHDNPRTVSLDKSASDAALGYAMHSKRHSHGEVLKDLVFDMVDEYENCIILLDEPESGLSITHQYLLKQKIKIATEKYACQFFIATHSVILIENETVFSLEHNKVMSGNEYIKKSKKKSLDT